MKEHRSIPEWLLLLALAAAAPLAPAASAQGTAFTYQGKLNDSGSPATGIYDLDFTVFSGDAGGALIAGPLTNAATAVAGGLFTVTLDFGPVFNGSNYWLEIGARTNGAGNFIALSPRQPLTPAPYAIYAANAGNAVTVSGVVPGGGLSGAYSNALALTNPSNGFTGTFTGNGAGLSNGATGLPLADTSVTNGLPSTNAVQTLFTPSQFGAVGDGVTDDSLAFSNMMTAVNLATRPTVWLQGKSYKDNYPLYFSNDNPTLYDGTISTSNNKITLVTFAGAFSSTMYDVTLGGPALNWGAHSTGAKVTYGLAKQVRFENVEITNFWIDLSLDTVNEAHFNRCMFDAGGSDCVYIIGASSVDFDNSCFGFCVASNFYVGAFGFGDSSTATNSYAVRIDSAQRVNFRNCDINACGSFLYSGPGAIIDLEYCNIEAMQNPARATIYLAGAYLIATGNTFGPGVNDGYGSAQQRPVNMVNCYGSQSALIANQWGAGCLFPPVEFLPAWGDNSLPFAFGQYNNQMPFFLVHTSYGDAGVTNYGPMQSFFNLSASFDQSWSDDNGGWSPQGNAFSQLIGGNFTSFGRTTNTTKGFEVGGPDYANGNTLALWSYYSSQYGNNLNLGHVDINGGIWPGPQTIQFFVSPNGTESPAVLNAAFNSTGDTFQVPVTAGGFASRATNAGLIAESGWTNNTSVNCIAYVSGTGINITNVDSSGKSYMTNSGVTGTVTIFMQPGASLQTKGASGSYHAE